MSKEPLKFEYDAEDDVLTIEGVQYSGAIFRAFSYWETGRLFEIVSRQPLALTIKDHGPIADTPHGVSDDE